MSWPTPQDYQEAMQNPRTALGDAELQAGRAEEDILGLPRPISGGFASVYKLNCPTRTWAVRCFLKEFSDQRQRYAAISAHLAASKYSFATRFEYLTHGIRVHGNWHPMLKMEWVQGEPLIGYVRNNIHSPAKLQSIALDVVEVVRVLNRAGVAHGDLQHGNILIANGKPKLIDYDGMYVPALHGWTTHEAGHPNYQLPRSDADFGPGLDNFSAWVIYLSLRALSVRPSLWTQFQGGDDCLLFRRKDFDAPAQSLLLQELKRHPELQQIAATFESLLFYNPLQIPLIDPQLAAAFPASKHGPDWISAHLPQAAPSAPGGAFDFNKQCAAIDQIRRPPVTYSFLPVPNLKPTPWPLPLPPPVRPAMPPNLIAPPEFQPLRLPPARYRPVSLRWDSFQRVIGLAALGFTLLWPTLAVTVSLIALLGIGEALVNAVVSTMFTLPAALSFLTWFAVLEYRRDKREKELNNRYEDEKMERQRLRREYAHRWSKQLKELQEEAQRRFDDATVSWNSAIWLHRVEAARRREAAAAATNGLHRAQEQWKSAASSALQFFDQKKSELDGFRQTLANVALQREAELKQIRTKAREAQLIAHLSQHFIDIAAIPDIGPARKAMLKACGIRTALDVSEQRIDSVSGFGPALTANVVQWRRNVEATFIFKVGGAIPPHEMHALEAKYQHIRELMQRQLVNGETELRRISDDAEKQLNQLAEQINKGVIAQRQAEADESVIPVGL